MSPRPRPRQRRGARGQATVEFALVLALLLFVVFGLIEFSVLVFDRVALSGVAGVAARAGALGGLSPTEAVAAADAAATASAADLLRCPLGTVTADDGSLHPGQMTVTVSCTYEPLTPVGGLAALLVGQKLDTALTLSATALQFLQG